ncbi:MAG: hypothetical protein FWD28_05985 [Treponema sp.]|nr:hypothetical protein [Treponema sp.]
MGEINKSIGSAITSNTYKQIAVIESNTNKQIAANAMFTEDIKSTLINNQIASEKAMYNHTQQLNNTFATGFSGISRQLGDMGFAMSTGLALLNDAVQKSSKDICNRLDEINDTLKNPLFTQARELYRMAFQNYIRALYKETLEDLNEAVKKYKTDPFSFFLLGQTYLFGINKDDNVIDLNASIESFKYAAKYIDYDAKKNKEASLLAAEISFYLGLAYQTKANDDLHNANEADYEKNLENAKSAYSKSWEYSNNMLESLYNRARCKVLLNQKESALDDLEKLILLDRNYCLKIFNDDDFKNVLDDFTLLISKLKHNIFIIIEKKYIKIKNLINELKTLSNRDLSYRIPHDFTEEIPYFDILDYNVDFSKTIMDIEDAISIENKKIRDFDEQKLKYELEQKEKQRQIEYERVEKERQAEYEAERDRQYKKEQIKEFRKKGINIFLHIVSYISLLSGIALFIFSFLLQRNEVVFGYLMLSLIPPVLGFVIGGIINIVRKKIFLNNYDILNENIFLIALLFFALITIIMAFLGINVSSNIFVGLFSTIVISIPLGLSIIFINVSKNWFVKMIFLIVGVVLNILIYNWVNDIIYHTKEILYFNTSRASHLIACLVAMIRRKD